MLHPRMGSIPALRGQRWPAARRLTYADKALQGHIPSAASDEGFASVPQVEKAGGYSSADGQCISSLDVPITEYDQRTQARRTHRPTPRLAPLRCVTMCWCLCDHLAWCLYIHDDASKASASRTGAMSHARREKSVCKRRLQLLWIDSLASPPGRCAMVR